MKVCAKNMVAQALKNSLENLNARSINERSEEYYIIQLNCIALKLLHLCIVMTYHSITNNSYNKAFSKYNFDSSCTLTS